MRKNPNRPSLEPQHINEHVWYYENGGSIDLMVDRALFDSTNSCVQIRIPSRKLLATLKRQGKA